MANTPRQYNPDSVGDNTGITFNTGTQQEANIAKWERDLIKRPTFLNCRNCNNLTFRILCDQDSDHLRMVCNNCKHMTRVLTLQAPQLNDEIARKTGLYIAEAILEL